MSAQAKTLLGTFQEVAEGLTVSLAQFKRLLSGVKWGIDFFTLELATAGGVLFCSASLVGILAYIGYQRFKVCFRSFLCV
jgi:hypothetical protein